MSLQPPDGEAARRFFGTDGVRGPYGGPVVNEAFARAFGAAVGKWIRKPGNQVPANEAPRILIGRDTRASGEPLAAAAAEGFLSQGAIPTLLGVLPTPAVSRAVCGQGAAAGLVVTASHNPSVDNGFKLFGSGGWKLSCADEAAIEALLVLPEGFGGGGSHRGEGGWNGGGAGTDAGEAARREYVESLAALLAPDALAGWSVVLDLAHGATGRTTPAVFGRLGARIDCLGDRPDGSNINAGVGSEHPEIMAARVRSTGARLGVAQDGDGDRCVLCDERGEILDGDEILAILAVQALRLGTLAGRTVVATVQSNLGLDEAVEAAGGRVVRTPVGDRNVAERMRAEGAVLGGESSGHIIWTPAGPTGDGLAAALLVAAVLGATGRPLSELRRVLRKFPQAATALRVAEKLPLETLDALPRAIRALEAELGPRGRVLVRYSGTEPKIRLLVEGPSEPAVRSGLERLCAAARRDLQVIGAL